MNTALQNSTQLRDIHLPDAVSWWPPAIGWWLVAAVLLLGIYLLPKLYRYLTYKPVKQVSNESLQSILDEYQQHNNNNKLVQDISKLLRQICMTYTGREASASLTGKQWIKYLNKLVNQDIFNNEITDILITAPYQETTHFDTGALIQASQQWINTLPKKRPERIGAQKTLFNKIFSTNTIKGSSGSLS